MGTQSIIVEIWELIKLKKRYWLLPIVAILMLVGVIIVFGEGSSIAPLIYTLF